MEKKLILIGGGGHCKSCIDVIEQSGEYQIAGILDKEELVGEKLLDYKIIGTDDNLENLINQNYYFLITIGQIKTVSVRKRIFNNLISLNAKIATVISPRAYVSKHAKIGAGTIVMHDAFINANAEIGDNCIINTKAIIEHDSIIRNHCHVSTASVINGGVTMNEGTFAGSNSVFVEGCETVENDFIKAGSLFKGKS